jgi:PTS system nitrogen regulatory IIA component
MNFRNLVDESHVYARQQADDYTSALRFLAGELAKNPSLGCSADELYEKLMQREELGGTVLPNGLAIPHVRLDGISDFWIALMSPPQPLIHQDQKLRLIALFLIPKSGSDIYLQTLSGLTKFTADPNIMDSIVGARTRKELLTVMEALDIKKDFLVSDIMTKDMVTVTQSTTLKEVADLLYSKGLSYIPVLSEKGQFIGELTLLDLIREGIPDYALRIGDISFLKSFEPFEELIRKEDSLTVREIMSEPEMKVHPDDSIASAALNFIRSGRRQLPVVAGSQLVGVLSIVDLLKKVIRV